MNADESKQARCFLVTDPHHYMDLDRKTFLRGIKNLAARVNADDADFKTRREILQVRSEIRATFRDNYQGQNYGQFLVGLEKAALYETTPSAKLAFFQKTLSELKAGVSISGSAATVPVARSISMSSAALPGPTPEAAPTLPRIIQTPAPVAPAAGAASGSQSQKVSTAALRKVVSRVYGGSLPDESLPEGQQRAALAKKVYQQRGTYPGMMEADLAGLDLSKVWQVKSMGRDATAAAFNQQQVNRMIAAEVSAAASSKTLSPQLQGMDRTRAVFEARAAKLLGRRKP